MLKTIDPEKTEQDRKRKEGAEASPSAGNGSAPAAEAPPEAEPAPPVERDSTPPTLAEAIRWHWILFLLPVVLLVGGAIAFGLNRDPEYTAESRLSVGPTGGTAGLVGFADASKALAAGYSEAIDAPQVIRPASRAVGISAEDARARLSASSTTDSPIIRVIGTGDSEAEAVRIANVAAGALAVYASEASDPDNATGGVNNVQDAAREVSAAKSVVEDLTLEKAPQAEIDDAQAELETARLEASVANTIYEQSRVGLAGASLRPLSPASDAESDRLQKLQLLGFAGLAGGLLLGAALAMARARW